MASLSALLLLCNHPGTHSILRLLLASVQPDLYLYLFYSGVSSEQKLLTPCSHRYFHLLASPTSYYKAELTFWTFLGYWLFVREEEEATHATLIYFQSWKSRSALHYFLKPPLTLFSKFWLSEEVVEACHFRRNQVVEAVLFWDSGKIEVASNQHYPLLELLLPVSSSDPSCCHFLEYEA